MQYYPAQIIPASSNQSKIGSLEMEIDSANGTVKEMEENLNLAKSKYEAMLTNEGSHVTDLVSELESQRESSENIKNHLEMQAKYDNFINEKETLNQDLEESNPILSEKEKVIKNNELKFIKNAEEIKSLSTNVENLQENLRIELGEKEDYVKNHNSAVERLEITQNEKLDILEKYETLENEKKALCSLLSEYEDRIKNNSAMIEEKERFFERLEVDMETQRKHHINKEAELITANDKIADIEKKLVSRVQEQANTEKSQIEKLPDELKESQTELGEKKWGSVSFKYL